MDLDSCSQYICLTYFIYPRTKVKQVSTAPRIESENGIKNFHVKKTDIHLPQRVQVPWWVSWIFSS